MVRVPAYCAPAKLQGFGILLYVVAIAKANNTGRRGLKQTMAVFAGKPYVAGQ